MMVVKRFYDEKLAQASYLMAWTVGSPTPRRQYIEGRWLSRPLS